MLAPGLTIGCRVFRLPRQGYVADECQDASAFTVSRETTNGRFAVADGAAESPHAALWARLLVEDFVRPSEGLPQWANWLPSLQEQWSDASGAALSRKRPDASVPWYLEPGLIQGAFATFLGLVIEETSWQALAVGDSCLFQVRQGALVGAFPIARAADFSNAPWLIGSRTSPAEVPHKNGVQHKGDWRPRDRFWLMTDALAQWFLIQVEAGGKPWLALDPLLHPSSGDDAAQAAFAAWIEGLRGARQLRNDDVTLLAVSL